MRKIIFGFLLSINCVIPQNTKQKNISPKIFDTLSTINNLFKKTEYFLDKEFTKNDIGRIESYVIDSKWNIYIADNKTIYKFSKKGQYINKRTSQGRGPGEFVKIGIMTIDGNDNLYIEDKGAEKIVKYSSELKFIKEFKKYDISPIQTMLVKDNRTLVCLLNTYNKAVINEYDINTGKLITKCGSNNNLQNPKNSFRDGGGMVIDGAKIYYVHSLDPQIHVIEDKKEYELLKKMSSGFKLIGKNEKTIKLHAPPYSTVADLKIYGKYLILMHWKPIANKNKLFNSIYNTDGSIIKENVPGFWLTQTKVHKDGKFYAIYDERTNGDIEAGIMVRILEGK